MRMNWPDANTTNLGRKYMEQNKGSNAHIYYQAEKLLPLNAMLT